MDVDEDVAAMQKDVDMDRTQGKPDAKEVKAESPSWGVTAVLKVYQAEGVAWLIRRYNESMNVILGDEMGLGKTLQAITFIAYLKAHKCYNPSLVVCPLSVLQGWMSEITRFTPKLRALSYVGQKDHRESIRNNLRAVSTMQDGQAVSFDILVTTYELVMLDAEFLASIPWGYLVVDEAQRLKNPSSVLFKTLRQHFGMTRRLLLTGTPIQNSLAELWSLLHFCNPSIFDDQEMFTEFFKPGKEGEACSSLKKLRVLLGAYMLRRTKAALVRTNDLVLPPVTEVTITVQLSPLQRRLYVSLLKNDIHNLLDAESSTSQKSFQNIVVQLRKACSHPYLFEGVEPEPFEEGEHLVQASSKLMVLDMILRKLRYAGHRVLIFAQMTRTLDILQDFLELRGYEYDRLDGSVRTEERFAAVRRFSTSDDHVDEAMDGEGGERRPFVFILSTRAGGVGLNLVAADTVIFFEQDWNPQADKQALQRAHRIGQLNAVLAINLICQHTVEEVIMRRAKRKLQLSYDVIGSDDAEEDAGGMGSVTPSSLQSMIMFNLHRLCAVDAEDSGADTDEMLSLVADALSRRGTCNPPNEKSNQMEDASNEDSIYTFDGQDYLQVRRGRQWDDVEESWASATDKAVLESWSKDATGVTYGARRQQRNASAVADKSAEMLELARAEKLKKKEDRKRKRWDSLGYVSLALNDVGDIEEKAALEEEETCFLHFVIGDCTNPAANQAGKSSIVLHFVDESGRWGRGGMFTSLSRLSQEVPAAYGAAHEAKDLHVGDVHLVPVSADDCRSSRGVPTDPPVSVGLAVVQSFDRRRKAPRGPMSMAAMETCIRKAVMSALSSCASVHVPRIGSRSKDGKNEWYGIERLLRKYATKYHVHVYIYYYDRRDHA